nr:MAG TPA: hypothetical protein [Caudoviricetes sp.]
MTRTRTITIFISSVKLLISTCNIDFILISTCNIDFTSFALFIA